TPRRPAPRLPAPPSARSRGTPPARAGARDRTWASSRAADAPPRPPVHGVCRARYGSGARRGKLRTTPPGDPQPPALAYRRSATHHSSRVSASAAAATSADTSANPGPTRPVNAAAGTVVIHAIGTRYVSTNRIAPGYAVTGKRADSYSASNRIERFSTATNQNARLMSPSQI